MTTPNIIISLIGTILFGALAGVSYFYYRKFRLIQEENARLNVHSSQSYLGRFDDCKVLFFLVMFVSAMLDLPWFLGCLFSGGPTFCVWYDPTYAITWFLHLIAVCGYAFTITVPCIMWSDMIDRKDGKLFFSKFPYDNTKRFFQVLVVVYFLNTIVDIVAACFSFRVSDPSYFQNTNVIDAVCTLIEPITILFISVGCVWCGYRLQNHIVHAKLGFHSLVKVIFTLNITMIIIAASYLARALLILRLVYFMPESYRDAMQTEYFVWVICTRWLPYNFCSFCLIYSMKSSGADVANKNRDKAGSDTDSLNTLSVSTHARAMALPLIQNEERKDNLSDDPESSLSVDSTSFQSGSYLSDLPYMNTRYPSTDRVLSVDNAHVSHLSQFHVQNSLHSSNATLAYSDTNHAYSPSSGQSFRTASNSER